MRSPHRKKEMGDGGDSDSRATAVLLSCVPSGHPAADIANTTFRVERFEAADPSQRSSSINASLGSRRLPRLFCNRQGGTPSTRVCSPAPETHDQVPIARLTRLGLVHSWALTSRPRIDNLRSSPPTWIFRAAWISYPYTQSKSSST